MIDVFLQFFPACCMFVALAVIVSDEWDKEGKTIARRYRVVVRGRRG